MLRLDSRTVDGVVRDSDGTPVKGAVVKLKNMKSLQIRSFYTSAQGEYRFHGLDKEVDFQVKADYQGRSSQTETISSFNERANVTVDLKLEAPK